MSETAKENAIPETVTFGPLSFKPATGQMFVVHEGSSYEMAPITHDDFPLLRDQLKARWLTPMETFKAALPSLEKLPKELQTSIRADLMDRVYADMRGHPNGRAPTRDEVRTWIESTPEGECVGIHAMLRKKNPGITHETATAIHASIGQANFRQLLDETARKFATNNVAK